MDAAGIAAALEAWFRGHGRDLPWRRRHDPYHVLLSEFILQQTRMETGLRYFARLRRRFPTLRALAAADEADVLAAWSGLGYYRRARNLHATAKILTNQHGGRIPREVAALEELPGIGPYTAGAIASIAFDEPATSLDGNQQRIAARVLGLREAAGVRARRRMEAWARGVVEAGSPRRINQALMDLGGAVCRPEAPRCGACPLRAGCRSAGRFAPQRARAASRPPREESFEFLLRVSRGRLWLEAPRGSGLLGSLWLPPRRRARRDGPADEVHAFSHVRWRIRWVRPRRVAKGPGRWVARRELAKLPHGALTRKAFDAAGL